ncbi:MAG: hypothetical protein COA57_07850 [Flavobacteriales bacterium]|nr:MAG: hypothetical protein COA57_07850 [Flavobacteriales bacterium]
MAKKKLIFIFSVFLMGFTVQTNEIYDACNPTEIKKKCKAALRPEFQYDASKSTKFTFKNKKQFKELEVPLYIGERYRFVFNTEGLPQPIDIEIYNKRYESKNREVMFSSREFSADQTEFIFEPERSRRVYIDYIVPPTADSLKKGCVIFALGYQIK